jgi:hypothetical protein
MAMNEENQQAEEQTVSVEFEEQSGEVKAEAQDSEETGTIVRNSEDQDSELENYSENVQKRINQLTAKRKQALEESEAAYNYANQMKVQNEELRRRLDDLDKGYINEYGSRVETQEVAAKRILKDAYDAGDTDKIAEANAALAQLAVEKERLRVQKARSEQQAQQVQVEQEQAPQRQPVQRVEELDPKLQSWMKQNPWFGSDRALTGAAQGIHEQIVGSEGFDPSTDEYYAEIDKRMSAFLDKSQGNKQNAPAVAPASSGRSATKRGGKKTVELTPGQVAFATKMKIPLEKYAQEVARLEKQRSA